MSEDSAPLASLLESSDASLQTLQRSTTARLSLGHSGPAVSTRDHLAFRLDHALARDAVSNALDVPFLERELRARNFQPLPLRSAAPDRATYLRRPDLGRTLHPDDIEALESLKAPGIRTQPGWPLPDEGSFPGMSGEQHLSGSLILLADGLSALAIERHALPLLDALAHHRLAGPFSLLPVLTNARVAIADHIGHLLGARMTVLLIGERPGLSSPDSLGCYLTWDPRPGRTDAERNCISNIRGDDGLSYTEAAHRIAHYITEAHRLGTTGIALKDPAGGKLIAAPNAPGDGAQAASATGTSMRKLSASETVLGQES